MWNLTWAFASLSHPMIWYQLPCKTTAHSPHCWRSGNWVERNPHWQLLSGSLPANLRFTSSSQALRTASDPIIRDATVYCGSFSILIPSVNISSELAEQLVESGVRGGGGHSVQGALLTKRWTTLENQMHFNGLLHTIYASDQQHMVRLVHSAQ